jgi:hypothetical protein
MTSFYPDEASCLQAFFDVVGGEAKAVLERRCRLPGSDTRASLHDTRRQRPVSLGEICHWARSDVPEAAVLIVENINLQWITSLATTLRIDPSFFAEHAVNPRGATPWHAIFGHWSRDHSKPVQRKLTRYELSDHSRPSDQLLRSWHIDGVIEYDQCLRKPSKSSTLSDCNNMPRTLSYDENYGWSCSTRISYLRARPNLCKDRDTAL